MYVTHLGIVKDGIYSSSGVYLFGLLCGDGFLTTYKCGMWMVVKMVKATR